MTEKKIGYLRFLWDVFVASLGAYGGPEAHYAVFLDQFVAKKKYLNEEEFVELMALTKILPGPGSTQTIIAIGHKVGGPKLALLTMVVWALPVLVLMTALSFMGALGQRLNFSQEIFRYIGPMAVGFVLVASYTIGKKVITNPLTLSLFLFGAITSYFIKTAWIFPLILFIGGLVSIVTSGEKDIWNKISVRPPWIYLIAFALFAIGGLILANLTNNRLLQLFEAFYRYGYLVIGGGQVVVPMMHTEMVTVNNYMTNQEFLTGFGIVQGMPGPMFSFSAYTGGMAARGFGILYQLTGAAVSGLAIFLPGVLLIFFVYPIWEDLKRLRAIKLSLAGITPVAAGLILASAINMMQAAGFSIDNALVLLVSMILLLTKKVPAPLIVLATILLGIFI